MNSQQEYEKFLAKLLNTIRDIESNFNNLSPENRQRFTQEANLFLQRYGYAITFEDLMQKYFG